MHDNITPIGEKMGKPILLTKATEKLACKFHPKSMETSESDTMVKINSGP